MKPRYRAANLVVALLVLTMKSACAQADPSSDVRDLLVGMPIRAIPNAGYVDLFCADDASRKLSSWSASRECPLGADGMRAVRFRFDPDTSQDGTSIAGHPVILTALFDHSATLAGLQIDTDPEARLHMRKKAFLLGEQAKSRYGSEGWMCTQRQPEVDEHPIGGVYIRESCRKTLQGRVLVVERDLFRRSDQGRKDFVNRTQVSITRDDE
jgi:hypothetical protein